jgi:hypothetical protein
MKNFIVITQSSWSFEISAKNYRDAISAGRKVCRENKEKFVTVKLAK